MQIKIISSFIGDLMKIESESVVGFTSVSKAEPRVFKTDSGESRELDNSSEDIARIKKSSAGARQGHEGNEIVTAVEKVNAYAELQQVGLRLKVDQEVNQVIISVVDLESEEVIRQIPSEHAIDLAKKIDEAIQELFIGGQGRPISLLDDKA